MGVDEYEVQSSGGLSMLDNHPYMSVIQLFVCGEAWLLKSRQTCLEFSFTPLRARCCRYLR